MITRLISDKNILLVCGSGGVGKTTVAAALGLKAAAMGRETMVLTIDPARRLATSLGLAELTGEPRTVAPRLTAMMLDSKRTFDQLVMKYAPNREVEGRILNNKIYQHMSMMISGSQEYMAMEQLYEIAAGKKYDLIVIDTPPTVHAFDFLDAPQKMVNMISHSMLHILLKPAMMVGKGGMKLFEKGTQMVLKVFDRITGFAFLQDISEMLIAFQDLLGGFESRAGEVQGLLRDEKSAFVLVGTARAASAPEIGIFQKKLAGLDLHLAGVILNRMHPYYAKSAGQIKKDEGGLKSRFGGGVAQKMLSIFKNYQTAAARDLHFHRELQGRLPRDQFVTDIPLFENDIHDIDGLKRLGKYLT